MARRRSDIRIAESAVRNVIDFKAANLRLVSTTSNGSFKFTANAHNGRFYVIKTLVDKDMAWGLRAQQTIPDLPVVVPQGSERSKGYNIVWREYVKKTMSIDTLKELSREASVHPEAARDSATQFISTLLSALDSLHSRELIHGALEPDRISINEKGEIRFIDVAIPSVFSKTYVKLSGEDAALPSRYAAPERWLNPKALPTSSWDIYSFLVIASDVLRPYRGSRAALLLHNLDARVHWLLDYVYKTPKRPSAKELHSLLFDSIPDAAEKLLRNLPHPGNLLYTVGPTIPSTLSARKARLSFRLEISENSLEEIISGIVTFPETAIALGGENSRNKIKNLSRIIAFSDTRRDNRRRVYELLSEVQNSIVALPSKMKKQLEFDSAHFPPSIDAAWQDSLHQLHFGFAMDEAHDERIAATELDAEQQIAREQFQDAIRLANTIRRRLLSADRYLTTAGVISEFSSTIAHRMNRESILVARRWGAILAIPDHERWLYPKFQFRDGQVSPFIARAFKRHRRLRHGREPNPWFELDFFHGKHDSLGGKAIATCLWDNQYGQEVARIIDESRV